MVEFLVHQERKLDVKTDVAARRLERLEREGSQLEDKEREFQPRRSPRGPQQSREAHCRQVVCRQGVRLWAPSGEVVFIHASVVQGAEVLVVGTDAWTQVVSDHARAEGEGPSPKGMGPESVEGGEGQREGDSTFGAVRRAGS